MSGEVLFYDCECEFCVAIVKWLRRPMERRGIEWMPLQGDSARRRLERYGIFERDLLKEVRFIARDGRLFGGADAVVELARRIWWARPLVWLAWFPGGLPFMRFVYKWVSEHRRQIGGLFSKLGVAGMQC